MTWSNSDTQFRPMLKALVRAFVDVLVDNDEKEAFKNQTEVKTGVKKP